MSHCFSAILSLSELQCKIVRTFRLSPHRESAHPHLRQEEFLCFLLLCRHVTSPPYQSVSLPPSSSMEVDGALCSSVVAESPLVSSRRRPDAARDAAGHQCPPPLRC